VFSQSVLVFIRVAEVPLMLAFWGTQLYGEWLMLAAIPTYFSIGDGGFAVAACRDMTMKSGTGDRNGALAVFQSTWLLLLTVSFVALLLAYGFAEWAPLGRWLGFSAMTAADTQTVLLLLVIQVLVGFQGGLLDGGFWVSGRYPAGMYLIAFAHLLEFLGLGLAVILGGGPVQAAGGYLGGRILGTVLMWVGQRRVSPWLRHGFAHASLSELRHLTVPAFASLAFPMGNALNIQGMRLVVGLALGPAAVAIFTPLRTLSRLAMQPKQIITLLVEPELAMAHGQGNEGLFRSLFLKSCQIAAWGSLAASAVVLIGGPFVLPYWTAGKIEMHWPLFILLLGTAFINGIWHAALRVPLATNRHEKIAIIFIISYGIVPLSAAYLLAGFLGLSGMGLALVVAELGTSIYMVNEALRLTQASFLDWIKGVCRPPLDLISRTLAMCRRNAP